MTETKYCPKCEVDVVISEWMPNRARYDGLSTYCRACHNKLNDDGRRRRREELLTELGGCCVRCRFSDRRALQIDHIRGNGGVERKAGVGANSTAFYKKVLANPDQYQILCANW